MTNKLVVIINSLKVPKIKKILLYEIKFLVSNDSCLQNPWLGGLQPADPRSLCPLSSTEFVEPPPRTKFLGTPLQHALIFHQRRCKNIKTSRNKMSMTNALSEFENHSLPNWVSFYGGNYNTVIDTRLVVITDVNCYLHRQQSWIRRPSKLRRHCIYCGKNTTTKKGGTFASGIELFFFNSYQ